MESKIRTDLDQMKNKNLVLNICHLYPDLMDTYGDKGNIITLQKRCQWRNIQVAVSSCSIGDKLPEA